MKNSNTPLRAAVVGVGYLGRFHAQKYKANPNVELVGVCDLFAEQAQKVATELGVTAFQQPQDLLGKVDLVTIACSTQAHYEVAELFVRNGIPVNVEKPITATLEQAQKLLKLADEKKVLVCVGQIERFNPSLIELKKELKKPVLIEMIRHATFKTRGADVSVLHDLMIHDLDMLFWLTGSEIESWQASGARLISKEIDSASFSAVMKNGTQVLISVSRVASNMQRSVRVVDQQQVFNVNTGSLEIEKAISGSGPELNVHFDKRIVEKADALQSETNAFVDAVRGISSPVVTGMDGLKALEWVEKIQRKIG